MITRFAPSPTGYLHLGHAMAAKTAFEFGGTCLLRIEDIDHTRCRPEYTEAIYEDLNWLRFDWPKPARIQSDHRIEYDAVIENLRQRGLIYRCFKTRKDLPNGIYTKPKTSMTQNEIDKNIDRKGPFAWRLNMAKARGEFGSLTYEETGLEPGLKNIDPDLYGDVVLARKDIRTSYLIACTHDDAVQEVTHIVRGADFTLLTGMQRIIQTLMGWPEPIYHHHHLLENADGEKLAKRNKDTAIRELRAKGVTASDVLDMASRA